MRTKIPPSNVVGWLICLFREINTRAKVLDILLCHKPCVFSKLWSWQKCDNKSHVLLFIKTLTFGTQPCLTYTDLYIPNAYDFHGIILLQRMATLRKYILN